MFRGLFITGTDTNVGKTVVAAALMHRYRPFVPARYWKPIQTGIEIDDDTATVKDLGECENREVFAQGIRLPMPVSPHLAARLSHVSIDISELAGLIAGEAGTHCWLVEGAGGVLVPINESDLMIDLMVRFSLPVLVVSRTTLGTINHTLLTLQALRARGLEVAGVVMVGESNTDNRETIERRGAVTVFGEMPHFAQLNSQNLREWAGSALDPKGQLLKRLL